MDAARERLLGGLAVAAAASTWGTLGLFAKILSSQGVSFESLVAVRASVGWLAVICFLLATQGARNLRLACRDAPDASDSGNLAFHRGNGYYTGAHLLEGTSMSRYTMQEFSP